MVLHCAAKKNRDAGHLQNFVYDALADIDADKLAADLLKAGKEKVPGYAFDCHTLKAKRKGRTKADFFREEQRALKPWQALRARELAAEPRQARRRRHPRSSRARRRFTESSCRFGIAERLLEQSVRRFIWHRVTRNFCFKRGQFVD